MPYAKCRHCQQSALELCDAMLCVKIGDRECVSETGSALYCTVCKAVYFNLPKYDLPVLQADERSYLGRGRPEEETA